jgi:hypothetical protein
VARFLYRAGIPQSVWRWATGWTAGLQFPAGARNLSRLHNVQTSSGAHQIDTEGFFPAGKAAGAWSWQHLHLLPLLRIVELYQHSPIHLHGAALNCFNNWAQEQLYISFAPPVSPELEWKLILAFSAEFILEVRQLVESSDFSFITFLSSSVPSATQTLRSWANSWGGSSSRCFHFRDFHIFLIFCAFC